jgi:colanic acid/amylovoran biosynthesis protein
MKIVLIHCYSDYNKGDLGIIIGTINLLNKVKKDIEINAISTFEAKDPKFSTDHTLLKRHVDSIYPAVLGRAYSSRGKLGLVWKVLKDSPKLLSIYTGLFRIAPKLFLGNESARSYEVLREADVIISKGGSFICNQSGFINQIRFWRLMSTFWLCFHGRKEVSILGQSLGPVYGAASRKLMNKLLSKCSSVVIRENVCLNQYPYIKRGENFILGNDMAFNLEAPIVKEKSRFSGYVGLTIKRFSDAGVDRNYSETLRDTIEFLVNEKQLCVAIIPHVTIDDDIEKGREIYDMLRETTMEKVDFITDDFTPEELLSIYGEMRLLIGTRLHSTIFALVASTPVINISYHGTKSRGVFERLRIDDLVIDGENINFQNVKRKIEHLLSENYDSQELQARLKNIQIKNTEIVRELIR